VSREGRTYGERGNERGRKILGGLGKLRKEKGCLSGGDFTPGAIETLRGRRGFGKEEKDSWETVREPGSPKRGRVPYVNDGKKRKKARRVQER